MFAPRRTTAVRRGAPLLAGLAVGAVLVGAAAAVTPEGSIPAALNAALGAPLPAAPPVPLALPPPPANPGGSQLTVPPPAALPPSPAPVTPAPALVTPSPAPGAPTPPAAAPAGAAPVASPAPSSGLAVPPLQQSRPVPGQPKTEVVELVNAERVAANCPGVLLVDLRLEGAAQGHLEDMVAKAYFAPVGPDGRDFAARIIERGHPAPGGENIAQGPATPVAVVEAWMASEADKRNILDCAFNAVGVAYEPSLQLWVLTFGR